MDAAYYLSAGNSLMGQGRLGEAEAAYRQALAINPDFAEAHLNLGVGLKAQGRIPEAEASYREALRAQPDFVEALNNLANILRAQGRLDEAEAGYRRALDIRPDHIAARINLSHVFIAQGNLPEGKTCCAGTLQRWPDVPEAHNVMGLLCKSEGRYAEAIECYRRALELRPNYAEAENNLGNVHRLQGRLSEAEASYRRARLLAPRYPEAHSNLGNALFDQARYADAEACYRTALELNPGLADTYGHLGATLKALRRLAEAEASYRQCLRLRPASAEALNGLGAVLTDLGRWDEAEAFLRGALSLRPDLVDAHNNLGILLRDRGLRAEAEASFRRGLSIQHDSDSPGILSALRLNLGMLLLSEGRFEEGWPLYEARYELPNLHAAGPRFPWRCVQWQGEPLGGRSLLVWPEQGSGDQIQFVRYLPLLKARGARRIVLVCEPALRPIFQALPGVDAVVEPNEALQGEPCDCWTYLLSIPMHLQTTVNTIPADLPYLRPDSQRLERWSPKLAAADSLPGLRVGLVWKGNPAHINDTARSIHDLSVLKPLWSVPGVRFFCIQKGPGEDDELPGCESAVAIGREIEDFADSAAIIARLDLVICVDTAIAHLAGSLGTPCWVLLSAIGTDWRWLVGRTDSPWYPGAMRLFRQTAAGDWSAPVAAVVDALRHWLPRLE